MRPASVWACGGLEAEESEAVGGPGGGGFFDDAVLVEAGGGEIRGELGDEGAGLALAGHAAADAFVALAGAA